MTRPRGMPPTPRARSSEMLPVEMAEMSCTSGSSLPRRMTAPLPNCFSMAETASSIAFSFSAFAKVPPEGSIYCMLVQKCPVIGKMTQGSDMSGFPALVLAAAALAQTPWEGRLRFTHDPPRAGAAEGGAIHVKGRKVRIEEPTAGGTLVILFDGARLRLLRPERKTYVELPAAQAPYATVPPASLRG